MFKVSPPLIKMHCIHFRGYELDCSGVTTCFTLFFVCLLSYDINLSLPLFTPYVFLYRCSQLYIFKICRHDKTKFSSNNIMQKIALCCYLKNHSSNTGFPLIFTVYKLIYLAGCWWIHWIVNKAQKNILCMSLKET